MGTCTDCGLPTVEDNFCTDCRELVCGECWRERVASHPPMGDELVSENGDDGERQR